MFVAPFLIFVVDELDDLPVADLDAHVFWAASKINLFFEAYIKKVQQMSQ